MKIIGHRGARGLAPENTLESLQAALDYHVDGIEFDVRITSDNVAVLAHDASVASKSGSTMLEIEHTTYDQLRRAHPGLCTLEDALRLIDRRAVALIELKSRSPGVVDPVRAVMQTLLSEGWLPADFVLLSFHYPTLKALHMSLPEIPIMVNESWSSVRAALRARRLGTRLIDIHCSVLWPGVINGLQRRGYTLYTYTLNNPAQAARWKRAGLAGVITDYPDRFAMTAQPNAEIPVDQ